MNPSNLLMRVHKVDMDFMMNNVRPMDKLPNKENKMTVSLNSVIVNHYPLVCH